VIRRPPGPVGRGLVRLRWPVGERFGWRRARSAC